MPALAVALPPGGTRTGSATEPMKYQLHSPACRPGRSRTNKTDTASLEASSALSVDVDAGGEGRSFHSVAPACRPHEIRVPLGHVVKMRYLTNKH